MHCPLQPTSVAFESKRYIKRISTRKSWFGLPLFSCFTLVLVRVFYETYATEQYIHIRMGLPILIPYSLPGNGSVLLWVPVHTKDVKKYGIDAILKAVKEIGVHGLSIKGVFDGPTGPSVMNMLDKKLVAALSADDEADTASTHDYDTSDDDV